MAVSNKKKVNILPINKVEAEEILCATTVCTIPVASSFTLMLEEPTKYNTTMLKLNYLTFLTFLIRKKVIKKNKLHSPPPKNSH